MHIAKELREQANQHPLDADLEMFNAAAARIEALERALVQVTVYNSDWAMRMDDRKAEAVHRLIRQAYS